MKKSRVCKKKIRPCSNETSQNFYKVLCFFIKKRGHYYQKNRVFTLKNTETSDDKFALN